MLFACWCVCRWHVGRKGRRNDKDNGSSFYKTPGMDEWMDGCISRANTAVGLFLGVGGVAL